MYFWTLEQFEVLCYCHPCPQALQISPSSCSQTVFCMLGTLISTLLSLEAFIGLKPPIHQSRFRRKNTHIAIFSFGLYFRDNHKDNQNGICQFNKMTTNFAMGPIVKCKINFWIVHTTTNLQKNLWKILYFTGFSHSESNFAAKWLVVLGKE